MAKKAKKKRKVKRKKKAASAKDLAERLDKVEEILRGLTKPEIVEPISEIPEAA